MRTSPILVLLTCLIAGQPARAAPQRIQPAQAAAAAQERFIGDVIDVSLDEAEAEEPDDKVYEVRMLTAGGDVIIVRIGAETGRYLGAEGPDLARVQRPVPTRRSTP